MILLMSVFDDTHARAVHWCLQQRGIPARLVDTFPLPSSQQMSIALDDAGRAQVRARSGVDGDVEELAPWSEVKAIWMRRFNSDYYDFADIHPLDVSAVRAEVRAFIAGLYGTLDICPAVKVNPHRASRVAADKPVQLAIAATAGLKVPRTLMSNDPRELQAFARDNGDRVIFKPFFQEIWREDGVERVQHARLLRPDELAMHDSIRLCPGIYQNYIEKAFELRVIVLGDSIRFIKIDSQRVKEAVIDWRGDFLQRCPLSEHMDVPPDVVEAVHRFMRLMDLRFGCIDMVVTPEGEYVFLEINDQGQFLWIEQRNPRIELLAAFSAFLAQAGGYDTAGEWSSLADFHASTASVEQKAFIQNRVAHHARVKQRLSAAAAGRATP